MLSTEDLERYDRQIMLPEIGRHGQEKLKQAKVLIAGAGGLGSPISLYLAAAGVGNLKIVDHDHVALSNLNRQILHGDTSVDKLKIASAKERLFALNSRVDVEALDVTIKTDNASGLAGDCHVVVDAMDNIETRFILNRAALELGIPFVHGAVNGFEGRALTVVPGKSACLRCMHQGGAPPPAKFPVVGVAPGVIGVLQATEVIKVLLGIGRPLLNRLLVYDGLDMTFQVFQIQRNPQCQDCGHLSPAA